MHCVNIFCSCSHQPQFKFPYFIGSNLEELITRTPECLDMYINFTELVNAQIVNRLTELIILKSE